MVAFIRAVDENTWLWYMYEILLGISKNVAVCCLYENEAVSMVNTCLPRVQWRVSQEFNTHRKVKLDHVVVEFYILYTLYVNVLNIYIRYYKGII